MDAQRVDLALTRIAAQVVENNLPDADFAIIGIRRRGLPLANRLAGKIEKLIGKKIPVGALDITLYRDDLTTIAPKPVLRETTIDFDIEGKSILLVDDVLYTGRTARAALDALVDLGRPRRVLLAVLIDRGHRELPIQANYVGRYVETTEEEIVEVRLEEEDRVEDKVVVVEKSG